MHFVGISCNLFHCEKSKIFFQKLGGSNKYEEIKKYIFGEIAFGFSFVSYGIELWIICDDVCSFGGWFSWEFHSVFNDLQKYS